jgi:hypothetical protein
MEQPTVLAAPRAGEKRSVAIVSLMWSLVLPACGFLGVKNADRTMLSCFCGWSFLIAFSSAFWCVRARTVASRARLVVVVVVRRSSFVVRRRVAGGARRRRVVVVVGRRLPARPPPRHCARSQSRACERGVFSSPPLARIERG